MFLCCTASTAAYCAHFSETVAATEIRVDSPTSRASSKVSPRFFTPLSSFDPEEPETEPTERFTLDEITSKPVAETKTSNRETAAERGKRFGKACRGTEKKEWPTLLSSLRSNVREEPTEKPARQNLIDGEKLQAPTKPMVPVGEPVREFLSENTMEKSKAEPSRMPKIEASRAALVGRWVQSGIEGNMDQLMTDVGVNWAVRRVAKGMNYGSGKTFCTISLDGDALEMIQEMPTKSPVRMAFIVGKPCWQETVSMEGKTISVKVAWDDDVLVLEAKSPDGKILPIVRRWVDSNSGEMKISTKTSKGGEVLRIFTKA